MQSESLCSCLKSFCRDPTMAELRRGQDHTSLHVWLSKDPSKGNSFAKMCGRQRADNKTYRRGKQSNACLTTYIREPSRPAGSTNTPDTRAYQHVSVNPEASPPPQPSDFPLATDAAFKQHLHVPASSANVNGGCHHSTIYPHTLQVLLMHKHICLCLSMAIHGSVQDESMWPHK